MKSKITAKYQVTIPRDVRQRLKLQVADALEWKVEEGRIYIEPVKNTLAKYREAIKVEPGDIAADIRRARGTRGQKGVVEDAGSVTGH